MLFDAGETLVRTATPTDAVARPVLEHHGIRVPGRDLERAMREADDHVLRRYAHGDHFSTEAAVRRLFVSGYRAGLSGLAATAADPGLAARLADDIYDSYRDTRHWSVFEDVLPALAALRAADIGMAIVSDWGHGLEAIVLELELGAFIQHLVVSSRLGVSKPDPYVFQVALARLGRSPDRAVFVGDTYVKDVLGARAAGIAPVLIDRPGSAPPVDCPVIRSMSELPALLGVPL